RITLTESGSTRARESSVLKSAEPSSDSMRERCLPRGRVPFSRRKTRMSPIDFGANKGDSKTNTFADAMVASIGLVRHCQYSGSAWIEPKRYTVLSPLLIFHSAGSGPRAWADPHASAAKNAMLTRTRNRERMRRPSDGGRPIQAQGELAGR